MTLGSAAASLALAQAPYTNSGRDLAATCSNCHGTGGVSSGEVPSLAGQPKESLVTKMQAFKSGNATGTIMPQLAKGYTDAQIDALAAWFSTQKPAR
jgi:cytochrome c553